MLRKWILTVFMGCLFMGAMAQTIEIKGHVADSQQTAISYANVLLQTSDSGFVAGTTTDESGLFYFRRLRAGDYRLLISSVGYATEQLLLTGLSKKQDLGTLILQEAAVSLDAVTVTASNQSTKSDRKIVYPSEQQVKASANGIELLQQLMLPRVVVDVVNHAVKLPGNGVVQLRINGVQVEQTEVQALLPSEIIRIEYHDNPGLRYGNADVVLDYIVRRAETGGTFHADLAQGVNALWGEHQLSGKVNHKQSEWSANYSLGPRDFYGLWRDNREEFHLADGRSFIREEAGEPGHLELYMHRLNATYSLNRPEQDLFQATVRYRKTHYPHEDYHGVLTQTGVPSDPIRLLDANAQQEHNPALDLYYQRELPHQQTMVFNLVGSYYRTQTERTYQEQQNSQLLTNLHNRVLGEKYSLIAEAIYEKQFEGGQRLSGGLRHLQAYSDNTYRNGHTYAAHMVQGESYAFGEWKGKWQKLDYTVGFGLTRFYFNQTGETDRYERYQVNPRLTLFYPFSGSASLRWRVRMNNEQPALSQLSDVEQAIDSFQIRRGNPHLKAYTSYETDLEYEFRKGWFQANLKGAYSYQPNAIMDNKFQEGNRIVCTYDNHRNWQYVDLNATVQVKPSSWLQLSLTGGMNHYINRGNDYDHRYTNGWYQAEVATQWKQWSLVYQLFSNYNQFRGETLQGGENIQFLQLNYQLKAVRLSILVINPFTDDYKVESANWNRYASYQRRMHVRESSQVFVVGLSYHLNVGRRFQSAEKRLHNADNDSGVMKSGK